jgi:hypothetical protein
VNCRGGCARRGGIEAKKRGRVGNVASRVEVMIVSTAYDLTISVCLACSLVGFRFLALSLALELCYHGCGDLRGIDFVPRSCPGDCQKSACCVRGSRIGAITRASSCPHPRSQAKCTAASSIASSRTRLKGRATKGQAAPALHQARVGSGAGWSKRQPGGHQIGTPSQVRKRSVVTVGVSSLTATTPISCHRRRRMARSERRCPPTRQLVALAQETVSPPGPVRT